MMGQVQIRGLSSVKWKFYTLENYILAFWHKILSRNTSVALYFPHDTGSMVYRVCTWPAADRSDLVQTNIFTFLFSFGPDLASVQWKWRANINKILFSSLFTLVKLCQSWFGFDQKNKNNLNCCWILARLGQTALEHGPQSKSSEWKTLLVFQAFRSCRGFCRGFHCVMAVCIISGVLCRYNKHDESYATVVVAVWYLRVLCFDLQVLFECCDLFRPLEFKQEIRAKASQ